MDKKEVVSAFIENVWNQRKTAELANFMSSDFVDHSLPKGLPANVEGTQKWIQATSSSFQHTTLIEDMVAEDCKVFIRIRMELKHIGEWRGHAATGLDIITTGYRLFEFSNGKICAQWAAIDGNAIEQAIIGNVHSCKV
ncbi:ester cyclase [Pedobacter sp. UBA4863]|uniref:ester cyclase n=1 Tax=Pedobacter sp. UBA4863 TaxID=1947060 RepID=UPI0025CF187B|nr:ester cyclase [Pedobacter sp. UBA4863]